MDWLAQIATPLVSGALIALMLGVGLDLTVRQVIDVARQVRPVALGVLANFVITPLVFYGLVVLAGTPPMLLVGMMIVAAVPIAPMVPPLAVLTRSDVPLAAGLMTICAFLTVPIAPVILALGLDGPGQTTEVDPVAIARTLFVAMLAPMGMGMLVRHLYEGAARKLGAVVSRIGRLGLVVCVVALLALHGRSMLALGADTHLVIIASIVLGIAIGHGVMAGESPERKRTVGMATGMRNIALAILIVNANFSGTEAVAIVMTQGLLSLIVGVLYGLLFARLAGRSGTEEEPNTA